MRKNYNLLFFLLFFCNVLFGQNAGDFMSVAPGGNWTSASSWKVYDGIDGRMQHDTQGRHLVITMLLFLQELLLQLPLH